ncbi:ABC transporter substrate-binding protein [Acuticoccus sp. MNP-M23]|uniref:ABC transporter substrate-binding protein n=1 Tax=Acuticoccus sp. MNP-M23 TaxID=3072793 RepID=UPI00281642C8|nr:ABC transporter substrate-binding protein [Acuticoccus sp. MNP-M23]WMS44021.1 ABC transporter substrate-binding protein [Acuticoccus sp. MNP-M23]
MRTFTMGRGAIGLSGRKMATAIIPVALLLAGPASAQEYQQAPMLDGMDLPPVAERLPEQPEVVEALSVGTYGGALRRGLRGSSDHNNLLRVVGPQGLTRWAADFSGIVPNVAERWDVNDEGTEFTFHLRKGMKWSDGEPFTADDIMFFFEDLLPNKDFYAAPPPRFVSEGTPATAEKIDDATVKITFSKPYGQFLTELATPLAQEPTLWAKHYCSQFHPKYNENIDELIEAENADTWATLFRNKCGDIEIPARWGNAERPTLDPWVVGDEAYSGGATRVVMERNPYFWQVDQEGNQLPYIDEIVSTINQDSESLLLEAMAGKIDMQARHLDAVANRPVLYENREKGGYDMFRMVNTLANVMGVYPNITHKDPAMREMIGNKEFRQAISHAIDREEIIDVVYFGQIEPRQTGPNEDNEFYSEKMATQFLDYDPDKANALLDGLGYTERDGDGFRLRPDGERVAFGINVIPNLFPEFTDNLELMKAQLADVGVDMTINVLERSIFYQRADANDFDMLIWASPGGLDPTLDPRDFVAMHAQGTWYAIPWANWYLSNGEQGEEPSESMKKRLKLYDQWKQTVDPAEQQAVFQQIIDEAADQFEVIGLASAPDRYGVVAKNLKNVPDGMPASWMYPNPAPTLPQTYYYEK